MAIVTGSVYDNYWVSHPIPQSDLQYSWLTASIHATSPYPAKAQTFGHAPADGFVSSSQEGVVAAYNFVSASEITNNNVVIPFAAHNTFLVDGVNLNQNLLSSSNFPSGYVSDLGSNPSIPEAIHGITLLRNGPYGYSSWRQLRTGEHPIARKQRRENILSVQSVRQQVGPRPGLVPRRNPDFTHYRESAVTYNDQPLELITRDRDTGEEIKYKISYGNNINYFENQRLNTRLGLNSKEGSLYQNFFETYATDDPVVDLVSLKYTESIYLSLIHI